MCGRDYRTYTDEELIIRYLNKRPVSFPKLAPNYNTAPTQDCLVLRVIEGERKFDFLRWAPEPSHNCKSNVLIPVSCQKILHFNFSCPSIWNCKYFSKYRFITIFYRRDSLQISKFWATFFVLKSITYVLAWNMLCFRLFNRRR